VQKHNPHFNGVSLAVEWAEPAQPGFLDGKAWHKILQQRDLEKTQ